jgi:hypothetical protein
MLAAVLILAGCGVDMLDPDGSTPTPTPSPLPEGVAQLRPNPEEALAPGKYSDLYFEPRVTFEIFGDTWFSIQRERGFFDIQQDVDSPDVIAVQFARPEAVYRGAEDADAPADAAEAVEILSSNELLNVVETDTSRMGGLEGSQVTFENNGEEVARFMDLPPGTIALLPDRRLWIAFFDTDDGLLAIMVGGSTAQWQEALVAAEPVLDSVRIGQ